MNVRRKESGTKCVANEDSKQILKRQSLSWLAARHWSKNDQKARMGRRKRECVSEREGLANLQYQPVDEMCNTSI